MKGNHMIDDEVIAPDVSVPEAPVEPVAEPVVV